MIWVRMLAYITGTVDQELLLRNEYLAAENRILRAQIKGRLLLSDPKKLRWLRSPTGLNRKPWKNLTFFCLRPKSPGSHYAAHAAGHLTALVTPATPLEFLIRQPQVAYVPINELSVANT